MVRHKGLYFFVLSKSDYCISLTSCGCLYIVLLNCPIFNICAPFLQALMYPLLVACKSISNLRRAAAQEVVDKVRQHSGVLVDQVI